MKIRSCEADPHWISSGAAPFASEQSGPFEAPHSTLYFYDINYMHYGYFYVFDPN